MKFALVTCIIYFSKFYQLSSNGSRGSSHGWVSSVSQSGQNNVQGMLVCSWFIWPVKMRSSEIRPTQAERLREMLYRVQCVTSPHDALAWTCCACITGTITYRKCPTSEVVKESKHGQNFFDVHFCIEGLEHVFNNHRNLPVVITVRWGHEWKCWLDLRSVGISNAA